MKRLLLLFAIITLAAGAANAKSKIPSHNDTIRVNDIINLSHNGKLKEARIIGDSLVKAFPNDYMFVYETALIYYQLGEYDHCIKLLKKVEKNAPDPLIYQLMGNACDNLGKPNEALEIYKKGSKRFPDAGMLYLESGNVYNAYGYTDNALKSYNLGIYNDPEFASNYYRGALLLANIENKAPWSIVYAETEILLNLNNENRFADMSNNIINQYMSNIKINNDSVKVTLSNSYDIIVLNDDDKEPNPFDKNVVTSFQSLYQGCVLAAATQLYNDSIFYDANKLKYITELRGKALDIYFDKLDNYFGSSMALFELQKKIKDAGYWEDYNSLIFMYALPNEVSEFVGQDPEKFAKFLYWYYENQLVLNKENTVGMFSINDHVIKFDLMEGMSFVGGLSDPNLLNSSHSLFKEVDGEKKLDTDLLLDSIIENSPKVKADGNNEDDNNDMEE